MEQVMRIVKGYFISLAAFALLTGLGAVIMKLTPFPQGWGFFYIVAAMMIACFFMGLYISSYYQRAGLLVGLCCGLGLIISILAAVSACFLAGFSLSLLKPSYLLPLGAGAAGGIIGANMKK